MAYTPNFNNYTSADWMSKQTYDQIINRAKQDIQRLKGEQAEWQKNPYQEQGFVIKARIEQYKKDIQRLEQFIQDTTKLYQAEQAELRRRGQ